MAKKNTQAEDLLVDVTQPISKVEHFLESNKKSLGIVVGSVVAVAFLYWAYNNWYMIPRETEAQELLGSVQLMIEAGDLETALNGNDQDLGLAQIAENYSGTKAANLANYYAGAISLKTGKFEEAIAYLDEFSTDDPILGPQGYGMIGDAFLELDQPKEAMEYYHRASKASDNTMIIPYFLMKLGQVAEEQGEFDRAEKAYLRIQKEFKESREGAEIEKYIARVQARKIGQ
jgi:tetratricopeptide (TPR) repeat protein